MAFLFGRTAKPKSNPVPGTKELLQRLKDPAHPVKLEEEISEKLNVMKGILQGTPEQESTAEGISQLVNSIIQEDLLFHLAKNLHNLPFEARKDTQTVFTCSLRWAPDTKDLPPAVAYIVERRPEIIVELCQGYSRPESALPSGLILTEALKHDYIAEIILYDEPDRKFKLNGVDHGLPSSGDGVFWQFFTWIDRGSFEVSTDAFKTFRDILTRHKGLVATYLDVNFELFFNRYNTILIQSNSYVTKRQSIKLLGEILLDRANYNVMMNYVDSGDHLKLCMNLLRDDRKMVQYEGFHVFKVFVANPNKSTAVQKILINNRDKLIKFLPAFLAERPDDEQFSEEKSFLVRQIEQLPAAPVDVGRG